LQQQTINKNIITSHRDTKEINHHGKKENYRW
jgi:hypothetical protein